MANKISGFDTRTGPVGAGRAVERTRDATTGPRAETPQRDGVHITGAARQLAELERAVKDMPAIDEARVAEVRAALAQGRYEIVPERIADQLMQLEQALARLDESER